MPSCFDRVPVLSYYISEHELPMMYELYGEVKVLDEKGNIVNQNVEVFVGGYSISLTSTEFNLKFSAPTMNEVLLVHLARVKVQLLRSSVSLLQTMAFALNK